MAAHLNTMDLVRALRQTLVKSRAEYEDSLRKIPQGGGPIFIVGDGPAYLTAQTAALSFENLAGRPCLVRSFSEFGAYDLPLLHPHMPVLGISLSRDTESAIEAFRAAKRQGAWLMVLTNDPRHPLTTFADEVFLLHLDGEVQNTAHTLVCAHAMAGGLGLYAGLIFKPQQLQRERLLSQLQDLPEHLDQVFSHSSNAIRQMIEEVRRLHRILILGCGFSRPAAVQAAVWMEAALGHWTHGGSPAEFPASIPDGCDEGTGIIFLSGSRSPHKKLIHDLAGQVERKKCAILAVTDGGDPELIRRARLSLLIPAVHEMAGAVLQLAIMQWIDSLAGREPHRVTETLSRT
ncbi:MAG: SIS domain-containing protein [Terriglobia bacterium]